MSPAHGTGSERRISVTNDCNNLVNHGVFSGENARASSHHWRLTHLDTYSHYLPLMGDQASGAMGDAFG